MDSEWVKQLNKLIFFANFKKSIKVESDALPTPPPLPKEIADVWAKINAQAPQQQYQPQPQQQYQQAQYHQQPDNHLQQQQQQQYYTKNY